MASANQHRRGRHGQKQRTLSAPLGMQIPSSLRDPTDNTFSDTELTRLSCDDNARDYALGHLHSHEQFAALWNSTDIRPNTRRWMRKVVQIQTLNAVLNGFYRLPNGTKVTLNKERMALAAQHTRRYDNDYNYSAASRARAHDHPSSIFVINGDCLDVLMCFKTRFPRSNPVVLNMASSRNPGGGWKNGAGAQEENLHRRTNMFQCLEDPYHQLEGHRHWDYHVPEFGAIYSPDVSVFRGSEANGYPFFPDGPKYVSFIACAAYSHPPTETDQHGQLKLSGKHVIENTKKKMTTILNVARENNHDVLILSAMGCGAFQNPPRHIAQLFHEVISAGYTRCFKYIVFAIINDHNSHRAHNPTGNIQPFGEIFQVPVLSIDDLQERLVQATE